jgi:hypothetical protein
VFATLAGGLPPPGTAAGSAAEALRRVVEDQRAAGLEPICDGLLDEPDGAVVGTALALGARPRDRRTGAGSGVGSLRFDGPPAIDPGPIVERWRATARLAAPTAAKAIVGGPYSIAVLAAEEPAERARLAEGLAEALNVALLALEAAGCPLVQIDEPAATAITAPDEARVFARAATRLLAGLTRLHPSLAVLGGDAAAAGPAAFFDPPFRSYLFDLIAGPENWRLVAEAPGDRGIVCGVVPVGPSLGVVTREVLVYAAQYAASTNGRGLTRVGLASAGSLGGLSYEEALARIRFLAAGAEAAVAAATDPTAARRLLDRRSWDMRAGGRPIPVRPERRDEPAPGE